jgi:phosphoribosylformylglycinamidine cyclo-ligase
MAHITGGGFFGNIPRILPDECSVTVKRGSWEIPPVFSMIQREAKLDEKEMYLTFNMGIGLIIITRPEDVDSAIAALKGSGLRAQIIGLVNSRKAQDAVVLD